MIKNNYLQSYFKFQKKVIVKICLGLIMVMNLTSCNSSSSIDEEQNIEDISEDDNSPVIDEKAYILPNIDLSNWKVTLPVGGPDEVKPPEILSYATDTSLLPFMYNDSIDGSLVFYTYPGATTANSAKSRTELREQMQPRSDHVNWTFSQGGRMKGTLAVDEISRDANNEYHRTIVMQIHGRLTNSQRDLIGEGDNNAPPVLKIYWQQGKIRIKTKVLKDLSSSNEEILHSDAWGDDEGYTFPEQIGFDKFTLEVLVSDGRMEVVLNDTDAVVYDNIHMQKWSVFENYFKAGNYLQTEDVGSSAKVKYYELLVEH